jgi:glycosyltransferase involved in cell wall biosynthesis
MEYEISVILPVYNGEAYLKKAIDSVLSQSFIDFEFIICDDASGDSSINIIKSFEDDRIQLIQNQMNMGLFATLNRLVKMAKGKLIKLWSQDDIMLKNCLEEIVSFHKKYPTISFSYSDRYIIDENDRIIN